MRVLSVTHGPSVPGGVFDEAVETAGHTLERWQVPYGGTPEPAASAITPYAQSLRTASERPVAAPRHR